MLKPLLKEKYEYQKIILDTYGEAVFISLEDLLWLHKIYSPNWYHNSKRVIWQFITDEYCKPCVTYILKPGTAASAPNSCCNGIRFGKDGDYISLPNLPAVVWS